MLHDHALADELDGFDGPLASLFGPQHEHPSLDPRGSCDEITHDVAGPRQFGRVKFEQRDVGFTLVGDEDLQVRFHGEQSTPAAWRPLLPCSRAYGDSLGFLGMLPGIQTGNPLIESLSA